MAGLTDLQINQRMACLSGYEIVEGPDEYTCYVETREDGSSRARVMEFDVLNCLDMTLQAIRVNSLDVKWDDENGGAVTVTLPSRLKAREFNAFIDCDGDISRAVCSLLLNAIGRDKP